MKQRNQNNALQCAKEDTSMQPGSIIYIIYSPGSKLLHFIKYQTSGEICVRAGLDTINYTMDRKCSRNIICVGGDTT